MWNSWKTGLEFCMLKSSKWGAVMLSACPLFTSVSVCLAICLSVCPSLSPCLSLYFSFFFFLPLFLSLSLCLSICPCLCLCVQLYICNHLERAVEEIEGVIIQCMWKVFRGDHLVCQSLSGNRNPPSQKLPRDPLCVLALVLEWIHTYAQISTKITIF